ncbi:MAG: substrate-binding domain-containing protein, partial [Treponema maltophilum]
AAVFANGAKDGGSVKDAHVFIFKSTGNTFGTLMYQGFQTHMNSMGEKCVDKSPADTTVAAQVQMIKELINQGIKSLTISVNGDEGFDEVIALAKQKGIKVISVDSALKASQREAHVIPASQQEVGQALIQAAVCIKLGVPYPKDGNMKKAAANALASYNGKVINLGILSAGVTTTVQNNWIAAMEVELKDPIYKGKVNPVLDKKYGDDDLTKSTTQANAFVSENKVDVIISPTTVGMMAAGEVLKSSKSAIKLTGLGLPSEMKAYMPSSPSDNEFASVCPYMFLWDVIDLGYTAAVAVDSLCKGTYNSAVGKELKVPAYGEYPDRVMKTISDPDAPGGTLISVGAPYSFHKGNMAVWIKRL